MENSSLSNGSPQGWMTTNPDSEAWSRYDSLPCCPCISHDHTISRLLFLSLSLVSPPPSLHALLSNSLQGLGCHYSFKPAILTTLNSTSDGGAWFLCWCESIQKVSREKEKSQIDKEGFLGICSVKEKKEREKILEDVFMDDKSQRDFKGSGISSCSETKGKRRNQHKARKVGGAGAK